MTVVVGLAVIKLNGLCGVLVLSGSALCGIRELQRWATDAVLRHGGQHDER